MNDKEKHAKEVSTEFSTNHKFGIIFEVLQTAQSLLEEVDRLRADIRTTQETLGAKINEYIEKNKDLQAKLEHEKRRADDLHGRRICELEAKLSELEKGEVQVRLITCPECEHTWTIGVIAQQALKQTGECPTCSGKGWQCSNNGFIKCPTCKGSGRHTEGDYQSLYRCPKCNGTGKVQKG